MRALLRAHRSLWSNRSFARSAVTGASLLVASLIVNTYANLYAAERQSNYVTDFILSNVPALDVDVLILGGVLLLALFTIVLLIREPQRIPLVLKGMALFIVIRAAFITMTHVGPFPQHADTPTNLFLRAVGIGYTADFFFSGHTGMPFLLALMFWDRKIIRTVFVFSSVCLGTLMLLGHLHYSIDVFAAFFITYSIYHLTQWLFPEDFHLFHNGLTGQH